MASVITKKGTPLPLHESGSTTFGTDEEIAVTVAKQFAVAERHFTIIRDNGSYVLKDLESGLGTRVNSRLTTTTKLVDGDRIQAGTLELVFSQKDGEASPEESQQEEPSQSDKPGWRPPETPTEASDYSAGHTTFFGIRLGSRKNRLSLTAKPKKKAPPPKPAAPLKKTRLPAPNSADGPRAGLLAPLKSWRQRRLDKLVLPTQPTKEPPPPPKPSKPLKKTRVPAPKPQRGGLLGALLHWRNNGADRSKVPGEEKAVASPPSPQPETKPKLKKTRASSPRKRKKKRKQRKPKERKREADTSTVREAAVEKAVPPAKVVESENQEQESLTAAELTPFAELPTERNKIEIEVVDGLAPVRAPDSVDPPLAPAEDEATQKAEAPKTPSPTERRPSGPPKERAKPEQEERKSPPVTKALAQQPASPPPSPPAPAVARKTSPGHDIELAAARAKLFGSQDPELAQAEVEDAFFSKTFVRSSQDLTA